MVYFLMALLCVIAWPLSKLLDCLLGTDHGTFYRRGQLKALIDLQGPESGQGSSGQGLSSDHAHLGDDYKLSTDEVLIIKVC